MPPPDCLIPPRACIAAGGLGAHAGEDVCVTTNGHGGYVKASFIVQGCDRGTFGSDCGPWSIPTSVKVPL
ncbi:hypothetical protein Msi02_65480 [Microbispora siamensis]|uniref:Uncharacterized protein n=1 Tax=Microbispora siamensis TaxID=564413 RepID=A0ABQ4GWE3_9ACTN|nr:hypothetical protein Msi02_65480 [Microbispora siamensis]